MLSKQTVRHRLFVLVAAVLLISGCASAENGDETIVVPPPSGAASSTETPATGVIALQGNDDDQEQTTQLIGAVQYVDGDMLGVNGLTVDAGNAPIDGLVVAGATIQVEGRQTQAGVVTADYIWVLQPPPEPTTITVTATNAIPVVIEGPVEAISGNRVRIHGIDLQLDDDPRLQGLQVGDVLRVGGEIRDDRLDDLFDDGSDDDIDDDRYVVVRSTQVGFLSNEIYASDDGQVWRDSGSCADAPPGWASADAWRSRCSGEFGGGPPAAGAGDSQSAAASGAGNSETGASAPSGAGGSGASGSISPPPPPPPPPPSGGDGDSSSGSSSSSGSGS